MARSETILEQYLESISWEAMEQYPSVIRKLIRGKSGVYALYEGDQLYYVGLASNLMGRLNGHVRDRHKGLWNRFSVYLTARSDQTHIRELEALLLRIVSPTGNRVSGRLRSAKNLSPELAASMRAHDADRRDQLLGGRAGTRRSRRRTATTEATDQFAPRTTRTQRLALQSTYKGVVYSASLRRDGQVRYRNVLYPSLSAAAQVIACRRINGRWFWKIRQNGEWVRIRVAKS